MKGIIFDFDGVIIDTEYKRFRDLNLILKKYSLGLEEEDFKDLVGKKTRYFLKERFPSTPNSDLNEIREERKVLQNEGMEQYSLISGIKDLLDYLKSQGTKLAICTGSEESFVKKILLLNSLEDYFEIIISGEKFNSSKPDPECYELALKELKLNPYEVIVIEDAITGISAAKKAKMKVFGVTTYLKEDQLHEADEIFKDHKEILNFLKNLDSE